MNDGSMGSLLPCDRTAGVKPITAATMINSEY
jgi:hypothetical protein